MNVKKTLLTACIFIGILYLANRYLGGPAVSQNGISINQLATNLITKYDVNENNTIEVSKESFLKTKTDGVIKTESHGLLFSDADRNGNNDGLVTTAELITFLSQFDTDKDSELTAYKNIFNALQGKKSEWIKFENKYGEKYKYE